MDGIGVGLIGTGFMGKCHAMAFRAVQSVFEETPAPRLAMLADVDPEGVERAARSWGFARWTTEWQEVVRDPAVDVVAITTPNFLHQEMALAAIAAGKHVYCEKPLALDAAGARTMAEAAASAGVKTLVGYNYRRGPAVGFARELICEGALGDIVHARFAHFEDYMTDPGAPLTWRLKKATAGAGALGDLGSHAISLAHFLVGEIASVQAAALQTITRERPLPGRPAEHGVVEVDDQVQALVTFASGAAGTIEASWVAAGRKMGLIVEVTGTRGALRIDHERMNELQLYETGMARKEGFRTILMGPAHPHYGAFCPAPGHQLGFNDLKVIEVKALLDGIGGHGPLEPDFAGALRIAEVVEAIQRAAEEGRAVRLDGV